MLIAFLITLLMATELGASVPVDLMFNHQPIDASCLRVDNKIEDVNLRTCSLTLKKHGYSYYKFFDVGSKLYWIFTVNGIGGSGNLTAISAVTRKNFDTLTIRTVFSGDRCNGGIQNVSQTQHKLTFSVNLTAYDLLKLATKPNIDVKAYIEVAACAVCCVARAVYELQPNAQPDLKYVQLNKFKNIEELPQQGGYQQYFNQIFMEYLHGRTTILYQDDVDTFVTKFWSLL